MSTAVGLVFSCLILQGALLVCANGRANKPNIVILLADDVSRVAIASYSPSCVLVNVSLVCPTLSVVCLSGFIHI